MLIENSNGPPDVSLELCSCRVGHIPEEDLVGQLGEGSQERLNGGIGTGRGKILKITESPFLYSREDRTYGNSEGDNTREDVRTSTSSLPADSTTPIVSRAV